VLDEMVSKSISVNGSRCLISYVNVVVLINKIQKYYTEQVACNLCFTQSFYVLCNPSPQSALPICQLIWPSMLSLSESKLSPWEWS
jgi:hypothetical protein